MLLRHEALADIEFLNTALEERFAYLRARPIDYRSLFEALRGRMPDEVGVSWLGLELQKVLAHSIDGHAGMNAAPSPVGYLPFLTRSVGDALVAFQPDRSGPVDHERPYLVAIDGVQVAEWLAAAAAYVPEGSPQLVRRESLRWLRAVQMLREDMGLPQGGEVEVSLAGKGGGSPLELRLAVAEKVPQFGLWPLSESGILDDDVGYLRLARMTPEAGAEVRGRLLRFQGTAGLVVDVRGNGGGSRDALLALLPSLLRWSRQEREALEAFLAGFEPEWRPPAAEFSAWHAMVVSPADHDAPRYHGRPVVVLMDDGCFSATDVFLSALKGLPDVVLVGEASSVGQRACPGSGAASFWAEGTARLYGVVPGLRGVVRRARRAAGRDSETEAGVLRDGRP